MQVSIDKPLDISRNSAWKNHDFHHLFLSTLRQVKIDEEIITDLKGKLAKENTVNIDQVLSILSSYKNESLDDIVASILDVAETYKRSTPEDTRTTQWPNNQNTKQLNPDHYFELHNDKFVKSTSRFINKETRIASAGSCFALRIAHQLQLWGYNYIIEEDDLPSDFPLDQLTTSSYRMAPARYGTLFNTPSLRQMVQRGFGEWEPSLFYYIAKKNQKMLDPFRNVKSLYNDTDGYLRDYQTHNKALEKVLKNCDVFIFTLGLIETWKIKPTNEYVSVAPTGIDPSILEKKTLSVEDNVKELEEIYKLFKKYNPGVKLIITVSPVPLNKSYSKDDHVVVANTLSKSTLRVAAQEFCDKYDDVYYFASFETVMFGTEKPWETDMRHVSGNAVEKVMELFQFQFLENQDELKVTKHTEHIKKVPLKVIVKNRIIKSIPRPVKNSIKKILNKA